MAKNMVAGTYAFTASARTTYQSTDLDGSGPPAPTANLFVNGATGNDAWDGTSATYVSGTTGPWATIGRAAWGNADRATAFADIPTYGPLAAGAGDIVSIAAGIYSTDETTADEIECIYATVNSGSSGNPITFIADGVVELRTTTPRTLIGAYQRDYISWYGFLIDEGNTNWIVDSGTARIQNSDYAIIEDCELIGTTYEMTESTNRSGVRIEDSLGTIIRNNFIHGYRELVGDENTSAITTYDTNACLIENNTIYDCDASIFIKGDHDSTNYPTYQPQHDNVIRYNFIHDCLIGLYFGGTADEWNSPGTSWEYTRAYQNLIVDMAVCGVRYKQFAPTSPPHPVDSAPDSPNKVIVQNNTFIRCGDANVYGENGVFQINPYGEARGLNDLHQYNNICYQGDSYLTSWADYSDGFDETVYLVSDYNCIYNVTQGPIIVAGSNVSLATWDSTYGTTYAKDTNSTTNDPLFTNVSSGVYTLQESSPCIDAGYDLLDLTGGGVGSAVTMGCFITGFEQIGATA